jgi:hypothetical protein
MPHCRVADNEVYSCSFCMSRDVTVKKKRDIQLVDCNTCHALYRLQFNPPDNPKLRARIECLRNPWQLSDENLKH